VTVITVVSAKHSPGTTTTALLVAGAADPLALPLVLEADPAGGDLAARLGVLFDPGMGSLVDEARRPGAAVSLELHARPLPIGVRIVVGAVSPAAVTGYADRAPALIVPLLREQCRLAVVDGGRWGTAAATGWAERSDVVLVPMRPTVESAEHVAERLPAIARCAPLVRPVVIGEGPLRPVDVAAVVEMPVAALPSEPVTARAIGEGRIGLDALRTTALWLAAESLLGELLAEIGADPARPVGPARRSA